MAALTNNLGIPEAEFIESIAAVAPKFEDAQELYSKKSELLSKYRLLEQNLLENQRQLKQNLPEVTNDLNAVKKLQQLAADGERTTRFQISDSLYGSATIGNESTVAIWLGANVMVEYPFDEAIELLQGKYDSLVNKLEQLECNLSFLRAQIITTEVTISRIANHVVSLRQSK